MVMAFVQGAFGKNVLVTFGLSTYVMLGLRVVYFNCSEPFFFGVDIICALEFNSPYFFPTFQLGGPLALPWGLYVLICQVQRISVTLYLQPCKLFLIKVQIS